MMTTVKADKVKSGYISLAILLLKAAIVVWLVWEFMHSADARSFAFDMHFWLFCLVGFVAQMIDGMLGMAYGVTCNSLLLQLGVPPALASANIHAAKVFTAGVSGLSHLYLKNVDKKLFMQIVIPGVIGATIGAYLLSEVLNGSVIKPFIAAYLLVLGIIILIRSYGQMLFKEEVKNVAPLGFTGGLLDAIGGGGWGPIVTSNILRGGKAPLLTIGTVNTAEFFVAFFGTGVFLFFLGMEGWKTLLGLIVGGIIAAPISAYLVKFIKARFLMRTVGIAIVVTSLYTIYKSVF